MGNERDQPYTNTKPTSEWKWMRNKNHHQYPPYHLYYIHEWGTVVTKKQTIIHIYSTHILFQKWETISLFHFHIYIFIYVHYFIPLAHFCEWSIGQIIHRWWRSNTIQQKEPHSAPHTYQREIYIWCITTDYSQSIPTRRNKHISYSEFRVHMTYDVSWCHKSSYAVFNAVPVRLIWTHRLE